MAALPIIVGVISAVGAISQANAASNAAEYNADLADRNSLIAQQQGDAEVLAQRRLNYQRLSSIKAATGANGLALEGSALDVLDESAAQAELDVQNIKYDTSLKRLGYGDNATLNRTAASNARSNGLWSAAGRSLTAFGSGGMLSGTGTKIGSSATDSNAWAGNDYSGTMDA